MKGQSLKLSEISRNLEGKMPYKSKRNKIERFLNNERIPLAFMQTTYLKFLFQSFFGFAPHKEIKLIIDYTDYKGYRLIWAGIPFRSRIFPCYFKLFSIKRRYSLKEIEITFLRNLSLYLPPSHQYVLVADRGFGNATFIALCESMRFKYVLRVKENTRVQIKGKKQLVSQVKSKLTKNVTYRGHTVGLVITTEKNQTWYLLSNLKDLRKVKAIYEQRFWTEEYFRDIKTYLKSGELKYKIGILKRLLFLGMICYNLVFEVGLKTQIDTAQYSASKLSFFPQSFFDDQVSLQEIHSTAA